VPPTIEDFPPVFSWVLNRRMWSFVLGRNLLLWPQPTMATTQAMADFARSKGADIRTAAPVAKILVEKGRAVGVRLENGEIVNSRCVLANTDPKRTFLKLLDSDQLDPEFVKDIRQIRMGHSSLRINLALKGLPDIRFFASGEEGPWHRSDICIFPDVAGLEANYFAAATGHLPKAPRLEITIPSTIFHGRHDLDQIFSLRPHPKAAQYRTPVENLYLCGSGAHPGGGVSGAPGHNAASRVIADFKRR
jgi:phytoene dehydrogenase-like protein